MVVVMQITILLIIFCCTCTTCPLRWWWWALHETPVDYYSFEANAEVSRFRRVLYLPLFCRDISLCCWIESKRQLAAPLCVLSPVALYLNSTSRDSLTLSVNISLLLWLYSHCPLVSFHISLPHFLLLTPVETFVCLSQRRSRRSSLLTGEAASSGGCSSFVRLKTKNVFVFSLVLLRRVCEALLNWSYFRIQFCLINIISPRPFFPKRGNRVYLIFLLWVLTLTVRHAAFLYSIYKTTNTQSS